MAYVRKYPIRKAAPIVKVNVSQADPHNLHARLMKQIAAVLDALETEDNISWQMRLQGINVMGRLIFADEKGQRQGEPADAGSAVKRYSEAFARQAPGTGGRTNTPRPAAGFALDEDDDLSA